MNEDNKKILNVLLDDDESFIVKKRNVVEGKGERIDRIARQIRESMVEKEVDGESKDVQLKRLERIRSLVDTSQEAREEEIKEARNIDIGIDVIGKREDRRKIARSVESVERTKRPKIELPYLSDVELKVLKAIVKYGIDLRSVMRATGYPDVVIRKAVEKLIEKGYLDSNLMITEKARPLVLTEKEEKPKLRVIDIAIIFAAIAFLLSTLHYFGYI